MKKENVFLILLLLFLSVPWSSEEELAGEDRLGTHCSAQVLKEREARRMANITITVRQKLQNRNSVHLFFFPAQ